MAAGTLSVDAATAIRNGLGTPGLLGDSRLELGTSATGVPVGVTAEQLADGAHQLLTLATGDAGAPGLNADALYRRARELRDELDEAGITARERIIHEQRAFRRVRRPNGCSRFILDGDLETSAWLDDLYDKLTSPRRGGPRFIDPADQVWAESVATDPRSTDQYLLDAMIGLLHKGVDTDHTESPLPEAEGPGGENGGERVETSAVATTATGRGPAGRSTRGPRPHTPRIVGSRVPAVRVLVTEESLSTRTGHGRLDGTGTPVSIETVERIIYTSGTVPIVFSEGGSVLDLGREQRLFSTRQKTALAARDGGCLWTDCDRPASWTEAHHINHWARDQGRTDLADGVLLCRHHHLLLHNNHWEIVREGSTYWLTPPAGGDAGRGGGQASSSPGQQQPRPALSSTETGIRA